MKFFPACVAFLSLALGVLGQQPPKLESLEWLEGRWDVGYDDSKIGRVTGQASVRVESDGTVLISYVLVDPRDGARHELTPFYIRQQNGVVTMELPPGGPVSRAESVVVPDSVRRIRVPQGGTVSASLAGSAADATVAPGSGTQATRLRLVREGDRLTGQWSIPLEADSQDSGGRSGKIESRDERLMTGPEEWTSPRMAIDAAERVDWREPPAGAAFAGSAGVAFKGRNLPAPDRREVSFVDRMLQPQNDGKTPVLRVNVDPKAVPGLKSLVMTDRNTGQKAPGVWCFDWPSLRVKEIHFARRTAGGDFDPAAELYLGEQFFVEVETENDALGDSRLYAIESDAPQPAFFHLQKSASHGRKFHAGPFMLVGLAENADGSATAPPFPSADQQTQIQPREGSSFLIRASVGCRLRLSPATVPAGEPAAAAMALVAETDFEEGIFQEALRQAEGLRSRYPDADRYDITKFTPLSGSRRTHISVQDHAALILLHRELMQGFGKLRRQYARKLSVNERRQLAASLLEAARAKADLPIFHYQVKAPDGGSMHLNGALYPATLSRFFGNDTAKRDAYVDAAISEAIDQMIDHSAQGSLHLGQADITQPATLLPGIKAGYQAVAPSLLRRLVRHKQPGPGEQALPRWIPDETGRAAVRGIPDLLGAIAADEKLADFQWGALQVVTLPASLYTGALGAAGVISRGALAAGAAADAFAAGGAAQNLFGLGEALEDQDAAWAAAPLAGYDPYRAARDEVKSRAIGAAVDVPMTLAGAAGLASDLARAGVQSSQQAARSAVSTALENGVDSLSDSARAHFGSVLDNAARKAASGAADQLTETERGALRANFPDGIPPDAASTLKLPRDDPNFVMDVGDSTLAGAAGKGLPPVETPTPRQPPRPEASSNGILRRVYEENLETARLGVPEAQAKMERAERAAAAWEQLPPDAQGRATEAMEIFNRLRKDDPKMAGLDESEALDYFTHHSPAHVYSGAGGHRPVTPEELAAEFPRFKGQAVDPSDLARAANISIPNAEAAAFVAQQRLPGQMVSPPSGRAFDPNAETLGGPVRAPLPESPSLPPPSPREKEIAGMLEKMGMAPDSARVGAIVPGVRGGDARAGAAHAAMVSGIPARKAQDALGMKPDELRTTLDDYLRRNDTAGETERRRLLDQYFGDNPTVIDRPVMRQEPKTEAGFPAGLSPQRNKTEDVRAEVVASLEKMGVSRTETEILRPEDIFPRTGGRDARSATAVLSRDFNVPASRAARSLGITETELAGALDRGLAARAPQLSPSRRAATVAADLRAGGVANPHGRVLEARQREVDAALRDFGIRDGDPAIIRAGVDPESAVIGQALERGIPAAEISRLRQIQPLRLTSLAREFQEHSPAYHRSEPVLQPASTGRASRLSAGSQGADHPLEPLSRTKNTPPVTDHPLADDVRLQPSPLITRRELAAALEHVGVDSAVAEERARILAVLGRRDAHQAIIAGAWQSQVPPKDLRNQFGYTDAEIATTLKSFLQNHIGVRKADMRNDAVHRWYSGSPGDSPPPPAAVASPPPRQPLRIFAAAPPVFSPPPPRPAPALKTLTATDLDGRFGLPTPPRGEREGEKTPAGAWRKNSAVSEIAIGKVPRFNPALRYNWLVSEDGRVLAAPEQFVVENNVPLTTPDGYPLRMGHPTLIDGGRARIAGELFYVEGRGWVLNNISGRYSLLKADMRPDHLENVASVFRQAGLMIVTDYH
jgi:hypothetical protein